MSHMSHMSRMTSQVIMSSGAPRQSTIAVGPPRQPYQSASHLLTWGVALSSVWTVTGLTLDGWAHTHELPDTFFTPWHGVIYRRNGHSARFFRPGDEGMVARKGQALRLTGMRLSDTFVL